MMRETLTRSILAVMVLSIVTSCGPTPSPDVFEGASRRDGEQAETSTHIYSGFVRLTSLRPGATGAPPDAWVTVVTVAESEDVAGAEVGFIVVDALPGEGHEESLAGAGSVAVERTGSNGLPVALRVRLENSYEVDYGIAGVGDEVSAQMVTELWVTAGNVLAHDVIVGQVGQ